MFCASKLLSFIGPVPTGLAFWYLDGSPIFAHRCCGTIYVPSMNGSLVGAGLEKVMTTVLAFVAFTLERLVHSPLPSAAGYCLSRPKVNSTSLALKSFPSDHLTPERVVNVSVMLSALQVWPVANMGVSLLVRPLTYSRFS